MGKIKLPVIGTVECKVQYKDIEFREKFFVVDVPSDTAKPLLSCFTLVKQLGILQELTVEGPHGFHNIQIIQNTNSEPEPGFSDVSRPPAVRECLRRNASVFSEGGLIKGVEYTVEMMDGARPHAPPARRLPPAHLPQVKQELDRLSRGGVIREITEPTEWCSPIVVALKRTVQYVYALISAS